MEELQFDNQEKSILTIFAFFHRNFRKRIDSYQI